MNINRIVNDAVKAAFETHAQTGFWKKSEFCKTEFSSSFLLFERFACEKQYFAVAHERLKPMDGLGIFTKKRKLDLAFLLEEPLTAKDLKVGQRVKLVELPEISKKYREGTVGNLDMLEDGIVDLIDCLEENGYQDTYGSCYVKEIVAVKTDDWHVFDGKKNTAE
jgi:hypothetical protein